MDIHLKGLQQLSLFQKIPETELSSLIEKITLSTQQYKKGETILRQGLEYKQLHILINGICYGEIVDVTGKTMKIEDFNPPSILASAVLFATNNHMPGSVVAKTACEIITIHKQSIITLCSLSNQFLHNLLRLISDKFLFISQKLSYFSFKTLKEKLVHYILSLEELPDGRRKLSHTIEELSEFFGVSRPSLSRVFSQLEAQGIITKLGKIIIIQDQVSLLEII